MFTAPGTCPSANSFGVRTSRIVTSFCWRIFSNSSSLIFGTCDTSPAPGVPDAGRGLSKSIDINDEDHPVAGQLIGSDAEPLTRAALILASNGYDVIDLNFACPVKKIKNKARGGHMLRDVPRALAILRSVRDALP